MTQIIAIHTLGGPAFYEWPATENLNDFIVQMNKQFDSSSDPLTAIFGSVPVSEQVAMGMYPKVFAAEVFASENDVEQGASPIETWSSNEVTVLWGENVRNYVMPMLWPDEVSFASLENWAGRVNAQATGPDGNPEAEVISAKLVSPTGETVAQWSQDD